MLVSLLFGSFFALLVTPLTSWAHLPGNMCPYALLAFSRTRSTFRRHRCNLIISLLPGTISTGQHSRRPPGTTLSQRLTPCGRTTHTTHHLQPSHVRAVFRSIRTDSTLADEDIVQVRGTADALDADDAAGAEDAAMEADENER